MTLTTTPTQIAALLPAQGEWDEASYLWLSDRSRGLIEFDDHSIEVLPMPTDRHQSAAAALFAILAGYFHASGGKALFAPLRIRLAEGRYREPDLVALAAADDPRREDRFWRGADLVVEVVSPDDPERDLVVKRREYAEAGITEYWIVDPRTETITVLALDGSRYREHGRFGRGETAGSAAFAGLQAAVGAVFGD